MKSKSIILSIGTAAALGLNTQAFASNSNVLQTEKLNQGYSNSQTIKLAEGKCGNESKDSEGKCGDKINKDDNNKDNCQDKKDGEGKCGEGKCGEGKCGS